MSYKKMISLLTKLHRKSNQERDMLTLLIDVGERWRVEFVRMGADFSGWAIMFLAERTRKRRNERGGEKTVDYNSFKFTD